MDITKTTTATTTTTAIKTPEAENETPNRIQSKPSFSNGVLKRTQPAMLHHHHGNNNHHAVVVIYKECLKNHAASLGGHALDGCGEFMPSPTTNPTDPTSLKCAACGCHRNFHRREPDEPLTPALEYQPHHRHHPLPPNRNSGGHSSPSSPSPPPISSSYYPSAPHMLLALSSAGLSAPPSDLNNGPISATGNTPSSAIVSHNSRKRFRTKFTQDQKDKMLDFAEKVGWKMQKRDEELISDLCNEISVSRGVLKVWMHNNKGTLGKKDTNSENNINNTTATNLNNGNGNGIAAFSTAAASAAAHFLHHHHQDENNGHSNNNNNGHNSVDSVSAKFHVATNGSSSSS